MAGRAEGARFEVEAPCGPLADGVPEFVRSPGRGVVGEFVEVASDDLLYKIGRRMFGLTDTQGNRPEMVGYGDASLQFRQFFKGVGVKSVEIEVQ